MRNAFQKADGTSLAGGSAALTGGALALLFGLFLGASACHLGDESTGPINEGGPAEGIGTSPSVNPPTPPPPLPTPPAAPGDGNKPDGAVVALVGTCPAGSVVIRGTEGDDTLAGSSADDCFVGVSGTDVIFGHGGRDVVLVAPGNQLEDGGDGEAMIVRAVD